MDRNLSSFSTGRIQFDLLTQVSGTNCGLHDHQ